MHEKMLIIISSPFLLAPRASRPQDCHQALGLELDLLLKPGLPFKFGCLLSGIEDFKGHSHQVGDGSLRALLSLFKIFLQISGAE